MVAYNMQAASKQVKKKTKKKKTAAESCTIVY